ncbi:MAG: MBOAT family O-acyltransferase [Gemmiger sp.]
MVFNSVVFLFGFLPFALLLYYLAPGRAKNAVLLAESLLFYCWTGIQYLPLITVLVILNYIAGLLIQRFSGRKWILALTVLADLGVLIYFKYANFLIETLNQIAGLGLGALDVGALLPLGISYYLFKLISYQADVCSGKIQAERDPITFAVYVILYPQMIVGPIVKYRDMAEQLHNTKTRCTLPQIEAGAEMFVFGLAKKVILADSIGALWRGLLDDGGVGLANVSTPLAWLGIAAYSLQLYFDFAGYSEMSNGLSKMMGFDCPANFDLPYIAGSITEFWRRWHISLSSWFRENIYIPLGGNRCTAGRQLFNMLVVWAATGIWHGASWNFICWGLYYFVLLTIEKRFLLKYLKKGRVWPHLYTLFLVVLGWGIFTANDPAAPLGLLMSKLFLPQGGVSPLYYLRCYGVFLVLGILCSTPLPAELWRRISRHTALRLVVFTGILILSTSYVVAATNSTALYANF